MIMSEHSESILKLQLAIDDLQTRIAYQEDTLQQLNDVISRQDEELREQRELIQLLHARLKSATLGDDEKRSLRDDIPPHY